MSQADALSTGPSKGTPESLNELLQSSRNLPRRSTEIGAIHLSLGEIQKKAFEMRQFNKEGKPANPYTKAHYLLIGRGITIEDIQAQLDAIDTTRQGEATEMVVKAKANSVQDYIGARNHENILTAIEQSLSASARDFDQYVTQNVSLQWQQQGGDMRSAIRSLLKRGQTGSAPSSPQKRTNRSSTDLPALTWSSTPSENILLPHFQFEDVHSVQTMDSVLNPNASYALRRKFELFAQVVYELNDARQAGRLYQLCTVFADLSKREMTTRSKQLHEAWLILRDFCEDGNEAAERRFAEGHCDDTLTSAASVQLRQRIAEKGRAYLESQFLDHVNEVVTKTEEAPLVSYTARLHKFLELSLKNKKGEWKVPNMTFVNGMPVWATLFYLLRAGSYTEAVALVSDNNDTFQKLERGFPLYFKAYCESPSKTLPAELQGRLVNEFNKFRHAGKEIDPYKYAVYKVVGRCDLSRKDLPSSITLTIEDWMWLHLSLVREDSESSDSAVQERYTLTDLQKSVLEFGADAFNASSTNPLYLQALLLVGLYEDAVQYLFSQSEIDAVHLAISLAYYGLLRVFGGVAGKLLNVDEAGFRSVDFARLIGYYTRSFKLSDPRVAAEYLFEICLCDGLSEPLKKKQIELAQGAVRELVLETREFVMLLGRIDKDGSRVPGIIEQRKKLLDLDNEDTYLHHIAEKAAQKAEEEGRPYDCILLYQLGEDYDTVLAIVNRLLGDFLVSVDFRTPLESVIAGDLIKGDANIVKLARRLMKTYNSSPAILAKTSLKQRETCSTLLELVSIAVAFTSAEPDLVSILQRIRALDIVPCSSGIKLEKVRAKAQEFNTLDEALAKNVPNMLVIEMSCVSQLVYELQQGAEVSLGELSSTTREQEQADLKQVSRNCMVYAGMVQYKMPRDVYKTLVSLEVDL